MNRRAKKNLFSFVLIICLIVCSVFIVKGFINVLKPDYPDVMYWEEYVVSPGDTLWTIVPHDNNYDIRNIIHMVKEHNNIGSTIYAYQKIELPVW